MNTGTQRRIRAHYEGIISLRALTPAADQEIRAARCRDVSLNGIFVESQTQFPPETPVSIELQLVGTDPGIVLVMKGRIVRTSPEGMGITFHELIGNTYEHLKNLVMYNSEDPEAFLEQCRKNGGFK